ncbi:hypothetical protein Sxan_45250 [Streptomyces xanthophaeus]|uniref:Uncharacterized protein n=1 Tax=Streptomyces xanthophaeus TaxID=67385 RepID=A0A919H2S1_9ACTN|nr:hypothetical protein Sxan_45250 [Streptomyces xanthophaeus]
MAAAAVMKMTCPRWSGAAPRPPPEAGAFAVLVKVRSWARRRCREWGLPSVLVFLARVPPVAHSKLRTTT